MNKTARNFTVIAGSAGLVGLYATYREAAEDANMDVAPEPTTERPALRSKANPAQPEKLSLSHNDWDATFCLNCGCGLYSNANDVYHCSTGNMYCDAR